MRANDSTVVVTQAEMSCLLTCMIYQANHSASLCFSFLISKMGVMLELWESNKKKKQARYLGSQAAHSIALIDFCCSCLYYCYNCILVPFSVRGSYNPFHCHVTSSCAQVQRIYIPVSGPGLVMCLASANGMWTDLTQTMEQKLQQNGCRLRQWESHVWGCYCSLGTMEQTPNQSQP